MMAVVMTWMCAIGVMAGEGSNDNSLADLGILTEGAEVFPEFTYGVTEYEVRVPAGTQKLELDPIPTNGNAWIVDITGTELVNGEATVEITVEAENGERYPYHLHVTENGSQQAVTETEFLPQTETETETEPETEDPRYVKVDRTTLQEAESTINALKEETRSYRDRSTMLMRILYGMIAFSIVLLFVVINLLLKKKDLKAELQECRGYSYPAEYYNEPQQGRYMAGPGENVQQQAERPEPPARRDDPETVPKPQKAKKKPKKMPEYQQQPQPNQARGLRKPQEERPENVEITMIDL